MRGAVTALTVSVAGPKHRQGRAGDAKHLFVITAPAEVKQQPHRTAIRFRSRCQTREHYVTSSHGVVLCRVMHALDVSQKHVFPWEENLLLVAPPRARFSERDFVIDDRSG